MSQLRNRAEYDDARRIIGLNLSGMGLSSLPSHIGRLAHLQTLNVSRNNLTNLPAEIAQLRGLQELDLSENRLRSLPPEVGQLPSLEVLSVGENRLAVFPPVVTRLRRLRSLDLSRNSIAALPPTIARLSNLRSLYLWENRLTALPPEIGRLISLQGLYLSGNQLVALPQEMRHLVRLQDLDVSGNQLLELPLEIVRLPELQSIELEDNPLRTPPPEIVARGRGDIRDFLQELAQGSVTRFEAKLLLVGEGGTGKTSLLRALRGEAFAEGLPTTHGIDIRSYLLQHPHQPGRSMTLHVWDFGGQQIYHTTHQFFMTKRSLYLLVWSARTNAEQARLDHWLRAIQVLAPDAPVILVATHVDECPAEFNYRRFKEAFPQLVDYVAVSNKDGTGIAELKSLIAREAARLPLMEQQWPKTWVAAEGALQDTRHYYVNLAEYTELCVEQGVPDEISQTALGGYLHDLGKVLYFQDDHALSDFVVLKPNWLTRAISRVLDDKPTRDNGGVLAHADFARIWDKDEKGHPYERRLYPLFLRLMERYLISFQLEDRAPGQPSSHSLVPLLLPHDPPSGMTPWSRVLPDEPEINMVFRMANLVPPGIMSWFIVLTHQYTQRLHWREGVRLQYRGHQAEVVLNPSKRELWLRVRGPWPANFFNILQHTINDRILQYYFEGLQYQREVPCNCHVARGDGRPCAFFHDYERLVERMKRGRLTTECGDTFEEVSVPLLLEGIHYTTDNLVAAKLEETRKAILDLAKGQARILGMTAENRALLARNAQLFEQLNRSFARFWNLQMASQNVECPNTFLVVPGDSDRFDLKELFFTDYTLHLLCQYPAAPHMVPGEKGYTVPKVKEWWAAVAPWLDRLMDFVRYIPRGRAVAEAYDEQFLKATQTSLDIFEAVLANYPAAADSADGKEQGSYQSRWYPFAAEGPALRALYRFLRRVDPDQHWCGLHRTVTNDGNILWLCDKHRELYEPY